MNRRFSFLNDSREEIHVYTFAPKNFTFSTNFVFKYVNYFKKFISLARKPLDVCDDRATCKTLLKLNFCFCLCSHDVFLFDELSQFASRNRAQKRELSTWLSFFSPNIFRWNLYIFFNVDICLRKWYFRKNVALLSFLQNLIYFLLLKFKL